MPPPRKYAPLTAYLQRQPGPHVTLSFREVEAILGQPLPAAAVKLATPFSWWANSRTTVQGNAWLAAGWQRETVDYLHQTVTFVRTAARASAHKHSDAAPP